MQCYFEIIGLRLLRGYPRRFGYYRFGVLSEVPGGRQRDQRMCC